MTVITETNFTGLGPVKRGKVRDIYTLPNGRLLLIATDRISAFDVVMKEPIPDKGKVLNQISAYWFNRTRDIIPNHMITTNVEEYPAECQPYAKELSGRSMLVQETRPLPVECIVRGYLAGSGWAEYLETGAICGERLPDGLVESEKLPTPIFTPSTKAELGKHDENISFNQVVLEIGVDLATEVRDASLRLYSEAADKAYEKGIIIADTKFEFGLVGEQLVLIDEVLTPDSSRFWPRANYFPGRSQISFDKQYLRDYLTNLGWNIQPPTPPLPLTLISSTREKYLEALERITGHGLA